MFQQKKAEVITSNAGHSTATVNELHSAKNPHHSVTNIQLKVNNTGLPNHLKTGIENLSGYSLDDVQVHYNYSKPTQLSAQAYAQGTDIHLGPGQEKHLPHEAWHVVQQKQGRVRPTMQMKTGVNINDDPGLEKEADVMGAKANSYAQHAYRRPDLMQATGTSPVAQCNPGTAIALPVIEQNLIGWTDFISELKKLYDKQFPGEAAQIQPDQLIAKVDQEMLMAAFEEASKRDPAKGEWFSKALSMAVPAAAAGVGIMGLYKTYHSKMTGPRRWLSYLASGVALVYGASSLMSGANRQ